MRFEFYVAQRYLRAKRRDRFFSVVTALSVAGVSAGVAALIIAMAVSNGFQASLREHLIGASSHINLLEKAPEFGIEDYQPLLAKLSRLEHVEAVAPTLYGEMMIRTAVRAKGCVLKGVDPEAESRVSQLLSKIVDGSPTRSASRAGRQSSFLRCRPACGCSTVPPAMVVSGENCRKMKRSPETATSG